MATFSDADLDLETVTLRAYDSESEDSDCGSKEIEITIGLPSSLLKDVLVTSCSLGTSVCGLAKKLVQQHLDSRELTTFADTVVGEIQQLLSCDRKKRIKPSNFWRKFHALRLSTTISAAWQSCVASFGIKILIKNIMLQVMLKKVINSVISHSINVQDTSHLFIQAETMTMKEENIVRYMASYVVAKLK